MASLGALVPTTWQEFLTILSTRRNRFSAVSSLPTNQLFDRVVATRAEQDSFWISLTWGALTLVTNFLTFMLTTVEHCITYILTREALSPTD